MRGTEQAGSGFWLSVCTELGSPSSPRTCAREPSRGACRARPPGGATESSRRGGAAAEPERYVGARTARSRGPAAPDGVPRLGLGRDPAREGAYRSVRPPRPAGHDQLGLRHSPLSEYAGRSPEHRPCPPLCGGSAMRACAWPHWEDARGVCADFGPRVGGWL